MRSAIDARPAEVANAIVDLLRRTSPSPADLAMVRGQLLAQGAAASSETIVESFYRCVIADCLQREYHLAADALPACVNSSHLPPRQVCVKPGEHLHLHDSPSSWAAGWKGMRRRHSGIDINVTTATRDRSLRRADLYVVARGEIVSLEFKYVGARGIKDVPLCIRQMQVYLREHAAALFVVYSGTDGNREIAGAEDVRAGLSPGVGVFLHGPAAEPAASPKRATSSLAGR
jgi:hypothetical protein